MVQKSKAKDGIKQVEQVVRYEKWVNQDTGETREFVVMNRPHGTDYGFHKVWLEDLAKLLGLLGGARVKVFNHILNNINPYSNEFGGTMREVAIALNVSPTTVQDTFKTLEKESFMKKVRVGTYLINAKFLVKGTHDRRVSLMLKYDDLNEGRQLAAFSPEEGVNWDG